MIEEEHKMQNELWRKLSQDDSRVIKKKIEIKLRTRNNVNEGEVSQIRSLDVSRGESATISEMEGQEENKFQDE